MFEIILLCFMTRRCGSGRAFSCEIETKSKIFKHVYQWQRAGWFRNVVLLSLWGYLICQLFSQDCNFRHICSNPVQRSVTGYTNSSAYDKISTLGTNILEIGLRTCFILSALLCRTSKFSDRNNGETILNWWIYPIMPCWAQIHDSRFEKMV
jgi:hypothetical protein